ncbi:2-oxoglutarate dehydrogenase E1 component [Truepera radiovictrix]|uniref:oxoglutarate dehydrogenase (succinyl-transferring) n=1 Tax=Truepera radiovictrix (strain DSM 17093 / CIP 108686 / LMG 22925 / RQ-24) TaxID=649638 RepID=D7CUP0_TRURR|nr:2-oxoglutarate dehydrogenase E1 component [Truepera radiovictrix]ADI14031.1 2-oxoglutarate dehydrogenase, E1 subunit [Truepera radiovictrix DSM 17093]WMT57409.1 2-oxoglutarate dehydrogenase E1 component [Truepera radiovictrix]
MLLNPSSLAFVEALYESFLEDPSSVSDAWRRYFEHNGRNGLGGAYRRPTFAPRSLFNPAPSVAAAPARGEASDAALQQRVGRLVRNYRVRGHIMAQLDPLGMPKAERPPELDPAYYGLEGDLERKVAPDTIPGTGELSVREVIERLQNTYCRSIGAQFMHIDDLAVRKWLQRRMETTENRLELSREEQIRILTKLTDAVIFEEFIQKKYVGVKSFSLEGGESLIPLLDLAIEKAGAQGIKEIVFGMAHRGRLNVLANIMGKSPKQIFREFDDRDAESYRGRGDVKYHLGYSSDWETAEKGSVHLSLCFNPSHLEFVNPVAMGRLRAKQDRVGDRAREQGLTILIHGDAAFIGEGVVQESLNLSELPGYRVGGTLHVIVNNQIGFTTGPSDARSSVYASDVAKMLQVPIFHVNGEDPEAVAQVVNLALDFRREFKRDVVIDLYCYRKYGHNEGDEPAFTQPLLYSAIRKRKGVREGYMERLLKLGKITQEDADKIADARRDLLERELSAARAEDFKPSYQAFEGLWANYRGGCDAEVPEVDTGFPEARLGELLRAQNRFPEGFTPHPKLKRMLDGRLQMASGERPLDWAAGELLAYASLVTSGTPVRLTGQDSLRGTFSHRHAALFDVKTGQPYLPLQHLAPDQAPLEIYNSPLSEAGVLGFEYGYSLDYPDGLVIWEAQFGDFANAAQVIIDQFIASGEEKWRRLSGLVMLLPHGFEGQGPEHSSARLERFLQLCASDNMQVVYPTTPAQIFHLLRRQVLRPWRKPLVVMSPKSLLRHPKAVSPLSDLAEGAFQRVIGDPEVDPAEVRRVLLCSGKVFYDLAAQREAAGRQDVAIIRLEQLYPLSEEVLERALAPFDRAASVRWVQEEPANMGAWSYLRVRFGDTLLGRPFSGLSRPAAASPATGSGGAHKLEQQELLNAAFAD